LFFEKRDACILGSKQLLERINVIALGNHG